MIMKENLVEILRQLLAGLRRNLWYTISTTSSYEYNLQAATSLNEEEYETLLLASGITVKKGDTTVYSNSKLEYLQGILRGRLDIHICRSKIDRNGIPLYFIAVERPKFRNPSEQAKGNITGIDEPNQPSNGLDDESIRLLERLCTERASATNDEESNNDKLKEDCESSKEDVALTIEEEQKVMHYQDDLGICRATIACSNYTDRGSRSINASTYHGT